jgi:hypothetical protein
MTQAATVISTKEYVDSALRTIVSRDEFNATIEELRALIGEGGTPPPAPLACTSGYWGTNGVEPCTQCPSGYRMGDGATSQNECWGEFTRTGGRTNPTCPADSCTFGNCTPETCNYTEFYGGTLRGGCANIPNCTNTITVQNCNANRYLIAGSCASCRLDGETGASDMNGDVQCHVRCSNGASYTWGYLSWGDYGTWPYPNYFNWPTNNYPGSCY